MKVFNKSFFSEQKLLIVGLFTIVHTWPFLTYKQWAVFGFDAGFYRRYLLEPFTSIPHASVPGLDHTVLLPRVLLDIVRLTHLPTDVVLYSSYLLLAVLLSSAFYCWAHEVFDTNVAFYSVVLVLLSPVYFRGYWFFLFKNFLALIFFFWLLISIRKQGWVPVIILSFCLPITHQSTTVLAGIIVFSIAILAWFRKENWKVPFCSWVIITTVYFLYHPAVVSKIVTPPVGIFLDWPHFFLLTWPLLLTSMYSFYKHTKTIYHKIDVTAYVAVVSTFLVFSLPYQERIFFFCIFPLSLLSGYLLNKLALSKRVLGVIFFCCAIFWILSVHEYEPLISKPTIEALASLERLDPNSHVLVPNHLASWAVGYTVAEVYAPGVFKDPYTPNDWELYWSHVEPIYDLAFLNAFPQPLFIFAPNEKNTFLPIHTCIAPIEGELYKYVCYNTPYNEIDFKNN